MEVVLGHGPLTTNWSWHRESATCIFDTTVLLLIVQFASTFPTSDPRFTVEGTVKVPINFRSFVISHWVDGLPSSSST